VLIASNSETAHGWIRLARWQDWGGSKLPFLAAVAVLLAPSAGATDLLGITATVAAGAAFGFGLNEVADRKSDARAGKLNRAAGLDRSQWLLFLVLSAAGAFAVSLVWAPDAAAPALVLLTLGLAIAYSVPPVRLKERGAVGMAGAAMAQWGLPVLVVAAAEPGGWRRAGSLLFALLSVAIGLRWIAVHQIGDASADRRAGVSTYLSGRPHMYGLLRAIVACELVLLGAALAASWARSMPAAIAFAVYLAYEISRIPYHERLSVRLAGYARAPLASYYFLALPVALAVSELIGGSISIAVPALLLALAVPQLVAALGGQLASPGSGSARGAVPVEGDGVPGAIVLLRSSNVIVADDGSTDGARERMPATARSDASGSSGRGYTPESGV
jgi:4-hydroxybenzoate polyprenyltransferase